MKKCPYCAEEIQDDAKICRFCRIDLSTGKPIGDGTSQKMHEVHARSNIMDGVKIGVGMFIVLPLIIIIGLFILMIAGVVPFGYLRYLMFDCISYFSPRDLLFIALIILCIFVLVARRAMTKKKVNKGKNNKN